MYSEEQRKKLEEIIQNHLEKENIAQVKKSIEHISLKTPLNYFGYRVLFDKLKHLKVELNIFKGQTYAGREFQETDNSDKKLRMVRLKINLESNLLEKVASIDYIQAKETIENVDIDFSLIEKFFIKEYGSYITKKLISPLRDLIDDDKHFKVGDKLITLKLDYDDFIKLVQFLSVLVNDLSGEQVNI
jgi:hypothetical protein